MGITNYFHWADKGTLLVTAQNLYAYKWILARNSSNKGLLSVEPTLQLLGSILHTLCTWDWKAVRVCCKVLWRKSCWRRRWSPRWWPLESAHLFNQLFVQFGPSVIGWIVYIRLSSAWLEQCCSAHTNCIFFPLVFVLPRFIFCFPWHRTILAYMLLKHYCLV